MSQASRLTPNSAAVVIICHNYGRFLAQAIESVIAQTLPATEIVVVLDHCSDESLQVAKRYPVEVIVTNACDPHLSRRLGARSTRSEIVLFLDADDWLSTNYLADGLPCFQDPQVGIVTGDIQREGFSSGIDSAQLCDIEVRNCVSSAALVRRAAIDRSRCFEDFSLVGIASEDWETWKRIARAGWTIATPSNPITHHHRRHGGNRSLDVTEPSPTWQQAQLRRPRHQSQSIRIGYVTPSVGMGGAETQIVSQIKHARHLEWIGVWAPDAAPQNAEILKQLPPIDAGVDGLRRLCQTSDVVYVWGLPHEVERIQAFTDAPIIYGVHGEGEWTRDAVAQIGDRVDALMCVSYGAVCAVPTHCRGKACLIRGGADLGAVVAYAERGMIREDWGLADHELAVGYVGRLGHEKNPLVIAQAVQLLPTAKLIVCSPQAFDHDNLFRRDIARLLGDRVVWTNSARQHMGDVYRGLDCLVVASHEEGMPTVTLEAWLAGLSVASTPVGLIQELEPRYGPLVERVPHDPSPHDIAQAIGRAVVPNPLRTETARELVLNELSMQRMEVEFEALALRLLANRRPHPPQVQTQRVLRRIGGAAAGFQHRPRSL